MLRGGRLQKRPKVDAHSTIFDPNKPAQQSAAPERMRPTLGALSGRGLGPRRVSGGFVLAYSHHLRGMEPEWAELSAAKGPFSAPNIGTKL